MSFDELGACYDHETDKIIGAKKGSLIYLHEEGHQKNKHNFERLWLPLSGYITIAILYLLLTADFWMVQLLGGAGMVVILADEIYAWYHALKTKRERERK